MRRTLTILLSLTFIGGSAVAAEPGPPYDRATGIADATTGLIGAVMARTSIPNELDLPPVEAGTGGVVGIEVEAAAGRFRAVATVERVGGTVLDPRAATCIRLRDATLPSREEGGGPVCEPLEGLAARPDRTLHLAVEADLRTGRTLWAEVYASWFEPHPASDGGLVTLVRVTSIQAFPVS